MPPLPTRLLFYKRAVALINWAEGLISRNGRAELVIVPLALALLRRLHLEEIHRMDLAAICANLTLAEEPVIGRRRLHLGDDGRTIRTLTAEGLAHLVAQPNRPSGYIGDKGMPGLMTRAQQLSETE